MKKSIVAIAVCLAILLSTPLTASAAISKSRAKKIALDHAGFKAAQVRFLEARKTRDDGRWIYEIEFRVRGSRLEYEYEIAYKNGRILDWDRDRD